MAITKGPNLDFITIYLDVRTIYLKRVYFKFEFPLFMYHKFQNSFENSNIIIILLNLHNLKSKNKYLGLLISSRYNSHFTLLQS